jgi:ribonuclease P protein component
VESSRDSENEAVSRFPPFRDVSFPRTARLLKPSDFKRVFSSPTVSSDKYFKVLGRINNNGHSRLGMAVSRQVDKHAVGRNRIKRLVREYFRHAFSRDGESPVGENPYGVDLVVLPRRACASICNSQVTDSLAKHGRRISRALERKNGNFEKQPNRPGKRRTKKDAGTN